MQTDLATLVTPQGALRLEAPEDNPLAAAFHRGEGHFLLQLGLAEARATLPPDLAFWRAFAMRFLATVAANGTPPNAAALDALAEAAPPMRGGEYLSAARLEALWHALHDAFETERQQSGLDTGSFLAARDSNWRLVGRVHFNLAENRKDAETPFAFLATYVAVLGAQGAPRHNPLGAALRDYAGAGAKRELLNLLAPVSHAAEACAWLKALVDSGEIFHPLRWTPREAMRLLADAELLEQAGIVLRMPAGWRNGRPSRPKVQAKLGNDAPTRVGAAQMLDFQMEVSLDGDTLTAEEIADLVAASDGLALLRGKWVEVDPAHLQSALQRYGEIERIARAEGISFGQAMRLLAGADAEDDASDPSPARSWAEITAGPWLAETLAACRHPETLAAAHPGAALRATLRPYQDTGVRWLDFLSRLGLGACLADDMGLGKTIQILALLLAQHASGATPPKAGARKPSLIVAPASLLANWAAEAERFAPSLQTLIAHPAFTPAERLKSPGAQDLAGIDLVLTSYGTLLRLDWLRTTAWRLLVLDEAQAIRNPAVKQTRAVKALTAESRIALTGTPVENSLRDLWSIFDFLNPGLLGTAKAFAAFTKRLSEGENPSYLPLRKLIAPYILRRLKTDRAVIADLPDKTEVKAFCSLTRKQAALYQSTVANFEEALKLSDDPMSRRGLVLATLMRLKQICNHPAHGLRDDAAGAWDGADSGKFARLAEIAGTVAAKQEKMLVFSQFREIAEPLHAALAAVFGRPGLVLTGETTIASRSKLVARFQTDESVPFFVLSLKAGGSGLTLTAASHVVHFDRWWNPAVENQATDRAFRIGQKCHVLVHKFICRGTIEERIDEIIEGKRSLAENLLGGGGEINLTELNDAELLSLVRLDLAAATGEGIGA
jgi:non-specific serine/threonine protein kinase